MFRIRMYDDLWHRDFPGRSQFITKEEAEKFAEALTKMSRSSMRFEVEEIK